MSTNTTIKIRGTQQSSAITEDLMNAFRDYIDRRLYPDYFSGMDEATKLASLRQRADAFTLLSFMEGLDVVLGVANPPHASFNQPIEVTINDWRLSDQHLVMVIDAVNDELISLEQCKELISTGDVKVLKEENDHIQRLLTLLRDLGVPMSDDYVQKLAEHANGT